MNESSNALLDQAAFRRVWRRVMPQDRADCPFTLEEPDLTPGPVLAPSAPHIPQAIPCLGEQSGGELPGLETLMEMAAQAWLAYRALGRRMGQRSLSSALATEKRRQLRRLGAAYFLIAGREYTPAPSPSRLPKTNALALRERFRAEQGFAAVLMDAGQVTADPCLQQLYRELAQECRGFTDRIRAWLEQGGEKRRG